MKKFIPTMAALLVGCTALLSVPAHAVQACKTLSDENQCAAHTSCRWVAGYQRKDGIPVRAHCRTRPGGESTGQQSAADGDGASSR